MIWPWNNLIQPQLSLVLLLLTPASLQCTELQVTLEKCLLAQHLARAHVTPRLVKHFAVGEICFVQNSVETDGDAVLSLAQDRHE